MQLHAFISSIYYTNLYLYIVHMYVNAYGRGKKMQSQFFFWGSFCSFFRDCFIEIAAKMRLTTVALQQKL